MAKALYGHVAAAPDRRLLDEVTRLRSRVQSLEFEITRLRAENDRLAAAAAARRSFSARRRVISNSIACTLERSRVTSSSRRRSGAAPTWP